MPTTNMSQGGDKTFDLQQTILLRQRLRSASLAGEIDQLDLLVREAAASANCKDDLRRLLSADSAATSNVAILSQQQQSPLQLAAARGHVGVVNILLEHGADATISIGDLTGRTALHLAAQFNHPEVVQRLLKASKKLAEMADADGDLPIHLACKSSAVDAIRAMAEFYGNATKVKDLLEAKGQNGMTPVLAASLAGDVQVLQILLQVEVNVEATDSSNQTILHIAALHGNAPAVRYLLTNFSSRLSALLLKKRDRLGDSPLHSAVRGGSVNTVDAILSHASKKGTTLSAIVESKGSFGRTPLLMAASEGNAEIVAYLIDKAGANVDATDDLNYNSALQLAIASKNVETTAIFISNDRSYTKRLLRWRDRNGDGPLHTAAGSGCIDSARLVLSLSTSLMLPNPLEDRSKLDGQTPLFRAASKGQVEMIKFLICEFGANVAAVDANGANLAHLSAASGHVETLEIILSYKYELVYGRCNSNGLPIQWASRRGQSEAVKFLWKVVPEESKPSIQSMLQWSDLCVDDIKRQKMFDLLKSGWFEENTSIFVEIQPAPTSLTRVGDCFESKEDNKLNLPLSPIAPPLHTNEDDLRIQNQQQLLNVHQNAPKFPVINLRSIKK